MDPDVPVFELEALVPEKKRRGVTVITKHGRALTFGISQARTKRFLETMAQRKNHELTAAMQEHKTELIRKRRTVAPEQ